MSLKKPYQRAFGISYRYLPNPVDIPDQLNLANSKAVIVIDYPLTETQRTQFCQSIIGRGCRYLMVWGIECKTWKSVVDEINRRAMTAQGESFSESDYAMATTHPNERIKQVFWYCKKYADHPAVKLESTWLLHLAKEENKSKLITAFNLA